VNVFPTLHEIAGAMENNFLQWARRRQDELTAPPTGGAAHNTAARAEEEKKLLERMQKFKDKMNFVVTLQGMPQRKRISFQKK
jgi:hypothetical protein